MFTIAVLQDLFQHLEWAEALVWTAALASEVAVADPDLLGRFQHIHLTQRAFLGVWTQQPIPGYRDLEFPSLRELYGWARPYYSETSAFLEGLGSEQLAGPMPLPWAQYFAKRMGATPATTTLGETIFQVTAHSAYHRGQVNTRLRVLGVAPPLVDYIGWLWLGRPTPDWPDGV